MTEQSAEKQRAEHRSIVSTAVAVKTVDHCLVYTTGELALSLGSVCWVPITLPLLLFNFFVTTLSS